MNFDLLLAFKLTLLWLYFGKSCKTTLFGKPREVYQNTSTFISIWLPITNQQPFKNMKNLCFLATSFSNKKNCCHLEFLMNQVFGQRFIILKKMRYRGQLCWNYGPSKLLLYCQKFSLEGNFAVSQLFCQIVKFNSREYQDFLPIAKFYSVNF